jgi:signal transduction histidine kinase
VEEASGAARATSNDLDRLAPALPAPSRTQGDRHARLRHDVRNHLASIRSTQELLSRYDKKLTPEERDHFRSVLEREVRRAGSLLVQAVCADDHAVPHAAGACLNPVAVVRDLVGAERAACEAAGVRLELREEARLEDAACSLDEVALARLVRNLLVNARQALRGRPDARLRVLLAREGAGGELRIQVDDNGPGIPAQDLARVWEAGFTTRGAHGGSGLGLCVVKELAESAGGSAEVSNLRPSGASFVVRLPPIT